MHARIVNGQVAEYPVNLRQVFPNVSFPDDPRTIQWDGYAYVHPSALPSYDSTTHRLREGSPVFSNGRWEASYEVVPLPDEEVAAGAEARRASMQLSFAQLLIGLVSSGWITEAEGDAWLAGTLPAAVLNLIATLPAEQRFAARARASRPSVVLRSDSLVNALASAQGKTGAEVDAFFAFFSQV